MIVWGLLRHRRQFGVESRSQTGVDMGEHGCPAFGRTKHFHGFAGLAAASFFLIGSSTTVNAGVIFTFTESGNDLVLTASGEIPNAVELEAAGFVVLHSGSATGESVGTFSSDPHLAVGSIGSNASNITSWWNFDSESGTSGAFGSAFGTHSAQVADVTDVDRYFYMENNPSSDRILFDEADLGSAIIGTMTWFNQSFASFGITTGTYTYGDNGVTLVTLIAQGAQGGQGGSVPEPSTALAILGLVFLGSRRRNRTLR
jgi:hypothetical protein